MKPSITLGGAENDFGQTGHLFRTIKASQFAREHLPTDIDDFLSPGGLVPRHPNTGIGAALNPEPTPRELRGSTEFAGHADAPCSLGGGEKELGIAMSATDLRYAHGEGDHVWVRGWDHSQSVVKSRRTLSIIRDLGSLESCFLLTDLLGPGYHLSKENAEEVRFVVLRAESIPSKYRL